MIDEMIEPDPWGPPPEDSGIMEEEEEEYEIEGEGEEELEEEMDEEISEEIDDDGKVPRESQLRPDEVVVDKGPQPSENSQESNKSEED